ncbi:MAG TPA: hypothetical protein VKE93_05840 [Candidatus Angelobacter sp.]|nr:hypothetical protein [Candidatus Angelobacter sp.]
MAVFLTAATTATAAPASTATTAIPAATTIAAAITTIAAVPPVAAIPWMPSSIMAGRVATVGMAVVRLSVMMVIGSGGAREFWKIKRHCIDIVVLVNLLPARAFPRA